MKNYEVVDMMGRRWATTVTASKAVRIAKTLEETKGIKCQVKEIINGLPCSNMKEFDSIMRGDL